MRQFREQIASPHLDGLFDNNINYKIMKKYTHILLLVIAVTSASAFTLTESLATVYASANENGSPCELTDATIPTQCSITNSGPQCSVIIVGTPKFIFNAKGGSICVSPYKLP